MKRFLFAAAFLSTLAPATSQGRLMDPDATVVDVDLDTLRRAPEAFMNVRVRFDIQFCSLGRIWNPFFTRFVPSEYANFYGWSGTQPIWQKESYDDVFGMLFLSKSSTHLGELYRFRTYDRLSIEGIVQNTFQGSPWIEVLAINPISGRVDTPTLAHLYRAQLHMEKREWQKAISELSLAPGNDQPSHVLGAINKGLGVCYLRTGESQKAAVYLATANQLMDGTDIETSRLAQVAVQDPASQLDRAIDRSKVNEANRPIWEAFDDVAGQPQQKTGDQTGEPAKPQR